MKRYIILIKSIFRDKMSLLSFVLPIILSILVNIFLSTDLNFVTNVKFALFSDISNESNLGDVSKKLEQYGEVVRCNTEEELVDKVKNVKDEIIGIKVENAGQIITVLAGDETTFSKSLAKRLPQMLRNPNLKEYSKQHIENVVVKFKLVFIALVMIIATFIGCTFTAMNVISEKEAGINNINEIIPQTMTQCIFDKILIGYVISAILAVISLVICIGINNLIVYLLPLILFGTYISSIIGLLIGIYSENLMIGITYIKMIMIFFIAVPLLFYLYFSTDKVLANVLNIIPSYTFFLGLIEGLEGIAVEVKKYLILFVSCIVLTAWCFAKLKKESWKKYFN